MVLETIGIVQKGPRTMVSNIPVGEFFLISVLSRTPCVIERARLWTHLDEVRPVDIAFGGTSAVVVETLIFKKSYPPECYTRQTTVIRKRSSEKTGILWK